MDSGTKLDKEAESESPMWPNSGVLAGGWVAMMGLMQIWARVGILDLLDLLDICEQLPEL